MRRLILLTSIYNEYEAITSISSALHKEWKWRRKMRLLFTIIKRRLSICNHLYLVAWLVVLEPCSPKHLIPHQRHTVSSKTQKEDRR